MGGKDWGDTPGNEATWVEKIGEIRLGMRLHGWKRLGRYAWERGYMGGKDWGDAPGNEATWVGRYAWE